MNRTEHELELMRRYLEGVASLEETQELESLIVKDASVRQDFLRYTHLDSALAGVRRSQPTAVAPRRSVWLSWRPLTAAAAGIVFGMLCTSVVFGYVIPRAVATASRLFALVDGSFEKTAGRVASGFPSEFGKWSGDEAEVVSGNAKEGKQALRFVRAEREPALPNYGAASCDVYQCVDLRSLKLDLTPGEATLELSVQFLDARESKGEPVKFISRVYVFSGSPDSLPAEWPLSQKEALAAGSGTYDSIGGSTHTWRSVTTKVLLPPGADFAVVHLVAHKPTTAANTTASFGEQFADDVRLTLKTQPTLPVQLARR